MGLSVRSNRRRPSKKAAVCERTLTKMDCASAFNRFVSVVEETMVGKKAFLLKASARVMFKSDKEVLHNVDTIEEMPRLISLLIH